MSVSLQVLNSVLRFNQGLKECAHFFKFILLKDLYILVAKRTAKKLKSRTLYLFFIKFGV